MKKEYKKYLWYAGISVAVALLFTGVLVAQTTVTWEGILPGVSTELGGTEAINIAWTQSTVGLDVSEETALTNTVHPLVTLTHQTSGTAAAGIGVEIAAYQEVVADELIGSAGWVLDDATAASEDASFSIELMAAGAAKAEKFAIESTGVVTLVNAATIDNSTNGIVTITEPTISLQGAIDTSVCTATADDTTPSVAGCTVVEFPANSGATAITDLDDPVVGAIYILIGTSATNSPTIADGANFKLNGTTWTGSVDESLVLYCQADNDYIELSRSAN
jgi:hypothetical protein